MILSHCGNYQRRSDVVGHERRFEKLPPMSAVTLKATVPTRRTTFRNGTTGFMQCNKDNACDPSLDHSPNNWPLCSIENTFA
jgi:hypothetical protein